MEDALWFYLDRCSKWMTKLVAGWLATQNKGVRGGVKALAFA